MIRITMNDGTTIEDERITRVDYWHTDFIQLIQDVVKVETRAPVLWGIPVGAAKPMQYTYRKAIKLIAIRDVANIDFKVEEEGEKKEGIVEP